MANKLELIFKKMEMYGWRIDDLSKVDFNNIWYMYLSYHVGVLEKCFTDYHYDNKTELKEVVVDSIGFITDFVNALKEVNYGE